MAAADMDAMADRYADRGVTSVFVYTREAHPGERYPTHVRFEDKVRNATALRDEAGVRRPILLDALDGPAHRAYGLLPNMAWIVEPGGTIAYKAAWTIPADIEDALLDLLDGQARRSYGAVGGRVYTERLATRTGDPARFRAHLEMIGPKAVRDFYGAT